MSLKVPYKTEHPRGYISTVTPMSSAHIVDTCSRTCFGNNSWVLALSCIIAQATHVFTVNTEHVLVADDQIRRCAVCSSVVLVNSEPLLKAYVICKLAQISLNNWLLKVKVNAYYLDKSLIKFGSNKVIQAMRVDMSLVRWSPLEISTPSSLTLVFKSAFWMVYPVISELPSSAGGSHSSAALKPHTSVTLTFRGGPGFSGWSWRILNLSHYRSTDQPQVFAVVSYR